MARPFNIRSRYGPSEQTSGEMLSSGVSGAINAYLQGTEAERTEQNTMRAAGGVPAGTPPSARDRFNTFRRGVGRVFGRGGPPSVMVDDTPPAARQPVVAPRPYGTGPITAPSSDPDLASPSMMRAQPTAPSRPGIGAALAQSVGEPDLSYTQTTRGGQQYRMDPMRQFRAQEYIKDQGEAAQHARRLEEIDRENAGRRTINADDNASREKIANYTYEQRRQMAAAANASREKVAQLQRDGRLNTAEGTAAMREYAANLRAAAVAMQAAGLEASGLESEARAIESKIPTGTGLLVEQSTPQGAARIDSMRTAASTARDSAVATRARGARAAESIVGKTGLNIAPKGKARISQTEYDNARLTHSDAQIAKSYDLTGIRRRP